ncbi:GTP-binding protein At2g22870 [Ziziphus jujuba]|uniref:GTP-binding protein At2g22870 n=1 Tax=Ziziphus jujuba TaxID=326968 RepID=A0A6P4AWB9_ZIZJJ|nr:GTP-binding protein At2g22870 [Ziziphus jujuba]
MLVRSRLLSLQFVSLLSPPSSKPEPFILSLRNNIGSSACRSLSQDVSAPKTTTSRPPSDTTRFVRDVLFVPPGVDPDEVSEDMVLPGSNIVVGPYAGDAKIKQVEFVKSSGRAKDCPKDHRPEFAILGRSNVGKSSLINSLVRKKEVALTSKKPGKTQLINHFLVNKSWYMVDLPGYGFAKTSEAARMDWSSFTKGYFLNRNSLVAVLLLVDASVPPQKIDLDCANWLGRNNIPITFVFTKCDKTKGSKGKRPDENVRDFQELIRQNYRQHPPPWIMTSSVTGLGRDELLLHMSQLRNYWDQ